jgi:integrase
MTGVIKNRHGTYYAQQKVPKGLEEATAQVLGVAKDRQVFLKKSLGTKDLREANIRAKPVLQEFDRILVRAGALLEERPKREMLTPVEIKRLADYHFAAMLASDEEDTRDGLGSQDALLRSVAKQLDEAGVEITMPLPLDTSRPAYGLSDREVAKRALDLAWELPLMRKALARGDIGKVTEVLDYLLDLFQYNVERRGAAYREAGLAVLRADVRALEAIQERSRGHVVDTPPLPAIPSEPEALASGGTLRSAFAGWERDRRPAPRTLIDYRRAVGLFVQLHGDLPIAQLKRSHARAFIEALQDTPRKRTGKLLSAQLPELAEWGRKHPEEPKITATTVNKLLGGVQAVALWARDKGGLIPDDLPWSDPFSNMRLSEEASGRDSFTIPELQTIFDGPVFTKGERPRGGQGDAAFWVPLLALFTGARRGELAGLTVADVERRDGSKAFVLVFKEDTSRGRTLKTKASARTVPLHSELMRLGFHEFAERERSKRGKEAWLFPTLSPEKGEAGVAAWTKWFGRHIRDLGIEDKNKVFHSLRHTFKDALRAASVPEDLNDALMGQTGLGTVARSYGAKEIVRRFGMPALVRAVSKVKYPGLNLSRVRARGTKEQTKGRDGSKKRK